MEREDYLIEITYEYRGSFVPSTFVAVTATSVEEAKEKFCKVMECEWSDESNYVHKPEDFLNFLED